MSLVKLLILFSISHGAAWADIKECPMEPSLESEESLLRYRDFFQHRQELEGVNAEIEKGAAEVKAVRETERLEQTRALEEHLKLRKNKKEELGQEQEWLAQKKSEQDEAELARRRYVQARDCRKKIEQREHKIPENLEFELDLD